MQQVLEQQILSAKDKMFRFALRLLGDTEDARDAVQDAMLRIWKQKEKIRQIDNIEAWSMQITKNLCLDRLKAQKIKREASHTIKIHQESHGQQTPYESTVQQDHMEKIRKMINELPEKFQMVIHLRDVEGFSYQEIADILAMSMDEVKVNLFRARKSLKDKLIKNKVYGLS